MFLLNYSTIVDPLLRGIRAYTVAFSGLEAGDRVLDIGCATGDQVLHYAKSGIIATGIDRNPHMLRIAERNRRKQNVGSASFQLAEAQHLPFRDSSFDGASISFSVHENDAEVIGRIVSEMKRVVKKNGVLIFTDFRAPLPEGLAGYFIRAIEFMVGRKNYRCFKGYIEQGGLEKILSTSRLPVEKRDDMNNRILEIVKATNV